MCVGKGSRFVKQTWENHFCSYLGQLMQSGQDVQGTENLSCTYFASRAFGVQHDFGRIVCCCATLFHANFPRSKADLILCCSLFAANQKISFSLLF